MIAIERLLLVEDDDADIELIQLALADERLVHELDVVHDGVAALDYLFKRGKYSHLATKTPQLIVLDLKMPKVSGLEVLRAIKSTPILKDIPVFILTSSKEQQDIMATKALGANRYIVKQVGFQGLVDAVKGFFGGGYEARPV